MELSDEQQTFPIDVATDLLTWHTTKILALRDAYEMNATLP